MTQHEEHTAPRISKAASFWRGFQLARAVAPQIGASHVGVTADCAHVFLLVAGDLPIRFDARGRAEEPIPAACIHDAAAVAGGTPLSPEAYQGATFAPIWTIMGLPDVRAGLRALRPRELEDPEAELWDPAMVAQEALEEARGGNPLPYLDRMMRDALEEARKEARGLGEPEACAFCAPLLGTEDGPIDHFNWTCPVCKFSHGLSALQCERARRLEVARLREAIARELAPLPGLTAEELAALVRDAWSIARQCKAGGVVFSPEVLVWCAEASARLGRALTEDEVRCLYKASRLCLAALTERGDLES